MKSKLKINVYESEILKSFHNQDESETFEFVSKMINGYEYPHITARNLIHHLADYVNQYVDASSSFEIQTTSDEKGSLVVKVVNTASKDEQATAEANRVKVVDVEK